MGLLNDNHQRARFFADPAHRRLFGLDVFAVYATCQQVTDQDVGRLVIAVTAELQHHVLSPFQVLYYPAGGVHPAVLHHESVTG